MIIGGDTVHMVCGYAFLDEYTVLGDVGGMRGIYRFVISKSAHEKQIAMLAVGIVFVFAIRARRRLRCLHVAYSAGGINGDTFCGGNVAIESGGVGAVGSDIAEEDVFVDERVTGSGVGVNE